MLPAHLKLKNLGIIINFFILALFTACKSDNKFSGSDNSGGNSSQNSDVSNTPNNIHSDVITGVAKTPTNTSSSLPSGVNAGTAIKSEPTIVSCEKEIVNGVFEYSGVLHALEYKFNKTCKNSFRRNEKVDQEIMVDILFVLDITNSMYQNIDTIKNNLQDFVKYLQDKKWNVRYGALGFRDSVVERIPFTTEATRVVNTVKTWRAEGGEELQEAGQLAMLEGIKTFQTDLLNEKSRINADKIILYVSDAVSYIYTGDKSNFSIDDYSEQLVKAKIESLPRLRIYNSTSPEIFKQIAPYSAKDQNDNILAKTKITGKSLGFPFTKEVLLKEFASIFDDKALTDEVKCDLVSIVYKQNPIGIKYNLATDIIPVTLSITDSIIQNGAELVINRCCNLLSTSNTTCLQKTANSLSIKFKK